MVWMQSWLDEVGIAHTTPGIIGGDNQGAIALTKHIKDHGKVKHIDIRHHYIRELIAAGSIALNQIPSAANPVDLFSKPLSRDHYHHFLQRLAIG